jgi:hypothetical protein
MRANSAVVKGAPFSEVKTNAPRSLMALKPSQGAQFVLGPDVWQECVRPSRLGDAPTTERGPPMSLPKSSTPKTRQAPRQPRRRGPHHREGDGLQGLAWLSRAAAADASPAPRAPVGPFTP